MQVHDELLCEIKVTKIAKVAKDIREIMETIYDIGVPLVVDVKRGSNWGEMKKLATSH
jgi:DNA polymerase-1